MRYPTRNGCNNSGSGASISIISRSNNNDKYYNLLYIFNSLRKEGFISILLVPISDKKFLGLIFKC
jgi:hypothetical protein